MKLQEVIDSEVQRGQLKPSAVHLSGVDTHRELYHSDWGFVCWRGLPSQRSPAVVMWVSGEIPLIHVLGEHKLVCAFADLAKHDLEFVDWLVDA